MKTVPNMVYMLKFVNLSICNPENPLSERFIIYICKKLKHPNYGFMEDRKTNRQQSDIINKTMRTAYPNHHENLNG